CSEIFETLRKYEYNPDLMRLYVTGGGGCLIKNFGEYDDKRVTIIDDICATAKGYEQLAYMTLRKKVSND
ncbi:MAG: plasmid segregation actin-type ATPase ParM, partial [Oscillospiraceae bacterium]|nr:plasmid segregation actin-type ATPase ParM [Oscillospiraceae bacterium]